MSVGIRRSSRYRAEAPELPARALVMGLGRHGGGVAAARFLALAGVRVTVTDLADEAALAQSLQALGDVSIGRFTLGRHEEEDFRQAECVVVNPAVRADHPLLELARSSGARITSESELFLERCPAQIIGVTGSNGKSTTSAMAAAMLTAAGRRAWLGGNIGVSLLPALGAMTPDDVVVLELSSFQLAHLSAACRLPEVAVVTNCTPNHLDWHGELHLYVQAKQRLLASERGVVVLGPDDPELARWRRQVRGKLVEPWPLERIPPLPVPGRHNRQNAACAAAAVRALGCRESAIRAALEQFSGLPHRLQFVGNFAGRAFYNDSKSTSPASTITALEALSEPVWLLAGGHNKGLDLRPLVQSIAGRARGVACFGSARHALHELVTACDATLPVVCTEHLDGAFDWCCSHAPAGEAILLSPACASYDQFRDYEARGDKFVELVQQLSQRT